MLGPLAARLAGGCSPKDTADARRVLACSDGAEPAAEQGKSVPLSARRVSAGFRLGRSVASIGALKLGRTHATILTIGGGVVVRLHLAPLLIRWSEGQ